MANKCATWHLQPLVNPVTNRKIKRGGLVYKKLEQECGPPPPRRSPPPSRRGSPPPSRRGSGSGSRRSPSPSRRSLPLSRRSPPLSRRSLPPSRRGSPPPSRRGSPPPSRRGSPPPSRRGSRRSPSPSRSLPPQRQQLYCGNNAREQGLLNGTKVLGTRYQCLKKGIGRGLNEPILSYSDEYFPIEEVKIFCGNGNVVPQNKDRLGTRDECLRKGFAVGQRQKYTRDGGIQRGPVVSEDGGWYKVYLPSALGPPVLGMRN